MPYRSPGSDSAAITSLTAFYANVTAAGESNTIGTITGYSGLYGIYLDEHPDSSVEFTDATIGGVSASRVTGDPAAGEFRVYYSGDKGNACIVECNSADTGKAFVCKYNGTGTNLPKFFHDVDGLLKQVFPGESEDDILKVDGSGNWALGTDISTPAHQPDTPTVSLTTKTIFSITVGTGAFSDGLAHNHARSRYRIQLSSVGFSGPGDQGLSNYFTGDTTDLTSHQFTNLSAGTEYVIQAQHKCDNGDYSDWSNTITITTNAWQTAYDLVDDSSSNLTAVSGELDQATAWTQLKNNNGSIADGQSHDAGVLTALSCVEMLIDSPVSSYCLIQKDVGAFSAQTDLILEFIAAFDGYPACAGRSDCFLRLTVYQGTYMFLMTFYDNDADGSISIFLDDTSSEFLVGSGNEIYDQTKFAVRMSLDCVNRSVNYILIDTGEGFKSLNLPAFTWPASAIADGRIRVDMQAYSTSGWQGDRKVLTDDLMVGNGLT